MSRQKFAPLAGIAAALLLMTGVILGTGATASAQDMAMSSHPAHIHAGDCAALGEVVAPLSNVGADFQMDGTPMSGMTMMGQASAMPVVASVSTVPLALADIVAGNHAINIHESAENIQNYVACGAIGGAMLGASDLPIGLGELNGSGYSGVAWLHDNGDGTTTVYVFLNHGAKMGGMEMATPTS
jgi:hypothetical protein